MKRKISNMISHGLMIRSSGPEIQDSDQIRLKLKIIDWCDFQNNCLNLCAIITIYFTFYYVYISNFIIKNKFQYIHLYLTLMYNMIFNNHNITLYSNLNICKYMIKVIEDKNMWEKKLHVKKTQEI